jgi:hypothetical protein
MPRTVNAGIGELPGNIVAAARLVDPSLGDNGAASGDWSGKSGRSAAWAESCGRLADHASKELVLSHSIVQRYAESNAKPERIGLGQWKACIR